MNTYFAITCLLALAAVATAVPPATLSYVPTAVIDTIPNPNYGFNYAVNDPSTGDNKAQWETRDGDAVQGAFSLVEPDGNVRLVEYTADSLHGFNAVVKRTGPNVHSFNPISAPVAPVIAEAVAAPLAPITPIHTQAIAAPVAPITPIHAAPIEISHIAPIAPIIEAAPILTHVPTWNYYPLPLPDPAPWVHVSGTTYGNKGRIVRRWTAGPISLAGKTLTIRHKH